MNMVMTILVISFFLQINTSNITATALHASSAKKWNIINENHRSEHCQFDDKDIVWPFLIIVPAYIRGWPTYTVYM